MLDDNMLLLYSSEIRVCFCVLRSTNRLNKSVYKRVIGTKCARTNLVSAQKTRRGNRGEHIGI